MTSGEGLEVCLFNFERESRCGGRCEVHGTTSKRELNIACSDLVARK